MEAFGKMKAPKGEFRIVKETGGERGEYKYMVPTEHGAKLVELEIQPERGRDSEFMEVFARVYYWRNGGTKATQLPGLPEWILARDSRSLSEMALEVATKYDNPSWMDRLLRR